MSIGDRIQKALLSGGVLVLPVVSFHPGTRTNMQELKRLFYCFSWMIPRYHVVFLNASEINGVFNKKNRSWVQMLVPNRILGGGFKEFWFSPRKLEKIT